MMRKFSVTQVSSAAFSKEPERYLAEAADGRFVKITNVGDSAVLMTRSAPDAVAVRVAYDSEAQVWYVEESSLFGLNAEAPTLEELREKLPTVILDLLQETDKASAGHSVPIEIIAPAQVHVPA
jgi:hypothetical protein